MEHRDEIGFQIHTLSHLIRHLMHHVTGEEDDGTVTGFQGRILGYLFENRGKDIFQRDIQTRFSVRRSTVTGALQLMEKNGLVLRRPVEWDARLKKLELTPKALEMNEEVMRGIHRTEEILSADLTPEEKAEFLRLCSKIRSGIDARLLCKKEEER